MQQIQHPPSYQRMANHSLRTRKKYKKKKKNAAKLCLTFLEDKALAITEDENLELAAVY